MDPFETEFDRWFSDEDRGLVFRRGKHKGSTIEDVARSAPDYLEWMLGADDMPAEVLEVVRQTLSGVATDVEDPGSAGGPPGPEV